MILTFDSWLMPRVKSSGQRRASCNGKKLGPKWRRLMRHDVPGSVLISEFDLENEQGDKKVNYINSRS